VKDPAERIATNEAPAEVIALVARFKEHAETYAGGGRGSYNETQIRREFIDPLFKALGWDIDNSAGYAEAYKDVIHEDAIRVGGATKAPDYCFRIGGVRKFFVEAKKPSIDIKADASPAYQLRRYAWSAKLPLSILTDFEEIAVYDCRLKPAETDKASTARTLYLRYDDLPTRWNELAAIFSRDAVLKGSFDKYADSAKRKRGTAEVDDAFLTEIEDWRDMLARNIALRNEDLSQRDLNFAVQRTIDRIVFLRICEDRGIERYGTLQTLTNGDKVYERLFERFHRADERYNSGLFHFSREKGRADAPDDLTPSLTIDDKPLKDILRRLYYPECPYEFSVLPADILGHVYEQFLGKVIRLTPGHRAVVEEKPEVRKAGGVYYTPTYIVDYIVTQTVGTLVEGKSPQEVGGLTSTWQPSKSKDAQPLTVLDPACGSGSFLLGAYQFLLDWYRDRYVADGPAKHVTGKHPRLYEHGSRDFRLTTAERKRILLAHIHGVDIDPQAVEVTKLSLLLKVLEGESAEKLDAGLRLFHERALPDLGDNIKCGNSLIAPDFYDDVQMSLFDEDQRLKINVFDWNAEFTDIMGAGGFDAVIGNPPYVLLQDDFRDDDQLQYFRSKYACSTFKLDTYHLFTEQTVGLTRPRGFASMITPANFLSNNHLATLRRLLVTNTDVDHVVVFDKPVFRGVSVDTAIWVVQSGSTGRESFSVRVASHGDSGITPVSHSTVRRASVLADAHALFTGPAEDPTQHSVWARCVVGSTPLGAVASVNFGKQLRNRKVHTTDVVELGASARVPRAYRRCYTGRDVDRYHLTWNGLACLDDREAQCGGCWDDDKQNAPNKLITRQIGRTPAFAIDVHGYQCLNTVFMVNVLSDQLDPRYVLAVLNSRVIACLWLERFFDRRRTFPKIKGTYLKHLPVPTIEKGNRHKHDQLVNLATSMTELRVRERGARTSHERTAIQRQIEATDRKIDHLVYELYGLTDDDIRVVEEATA
jgi:hypothetical protein